MLLSFADGGSASAMHFHKTIETGIRSNVFLLKVITLDLVTSAAGSQKKNPNSKLWKKPVLKDILLPWRYNSETHKIKLILPKQVKN